MDRSSPLFRLAALPILTEDPGRSLTLVVEAAPAILEADIVVFFEIDEQGGAFDPQLAAPAGVDMSAVGRLSLASGTSPLGQAIAARAARLAEPATDPLARSLGLASVAYAPAVIADSLAGILAAGRRPGPLPAFNAAELDLFTMLGRRAGAAVQINRLASGATRLNELSLIVQTITDVSSSLDLDAVLKSVAVNMLSATAAQGVTLSLWDRAAGRVVSRLQLQRGVSRRESLRGTAVYDLREYPVLRQALESRKPVQMVASDAGLGASDMARLRDQGVKSLLVLPLIARGEVIGLVELQELRAERAFTQHEVDLAQALANQAAVALLNAQLYQTTEARAAELALINSIGRHVTASLDLDQTLQRVIRRTRQVLKVEACVLLLQDEATGELVRHTAEDTPPGLHPRRLQLGEGIAGWVMKHAKPRVVTDILGDPQFSNTVDHATGLLTRSVVCVPLAARDRRIIGVIEAINKLEGRFSDSDVSLLGSVASWAAAAIEHAKLFTETERRARELAARNAVSQSLTTSLDMRVFLPAVAPHFARLADGSSCYIVLWDAARQTPVPVAAYAGNAVEGEAEPPTALPSAAAQVVQRDVALLTRFMVDHRSPLIIPDVTKSPYVAAEVAERLPDRSWLTLPLETGGSVVGAVIIGHAQPGHFGIDHIRDSLPMAQQVALAVSNAQLFAQAQEERRKLNAVLHDTADAVVVTDLDGNIAIANRAARLAFGWSGDEIVGQPAAEAFPFAQPFADLLGRAALESQPASAEIDSGAGRTYAATVSPVAGVGRAAVMRDITYLKELERVRSELVGTAAHDLKSPLASIQLAVDLIVALGGLNEKQLQHAASVRRAVRQMVALITDLLEITRIEAGIPLKLATCRIAEHLDMASIALSAQAAAKQIIVEQEIAANLPSVQADPARLRQVLTNLISNAIKYTPQGGKVRLSARPENGMVLVQVADTGMGIAASDLPKVFDRFFRAQNVVLQDIEGTGLGLSIVKSLIERHGGRVWLDSAEGQGTTVSFTLPRDTAA
jgi:PAS domain S-box-containing protein